MKMLTYLMCQLMELIEADVLAKESANVAKKQRKKNTMDDESWNWEGRRLGNANLLKISFVLEVFRFYLYNQ